MSLTSALHKTVNRCAVLLMVATLIMCTVLYLHLIEQQIFFEYLDSERNHVYKHPNQQNIAETKECKGMFSLIESSERTSQLSFFVQSAIHSLKSDLEKSDIWNREYYIKLSKLIPSVLKKNMRDFNIEVINETLAASLCDTLFTMKLTLSRAADASDDEVSLAKLCMAWRQKSFSYQLSFKSNRVEQFNGQLPYLNCKMKEKYDRQELLLCFRRAVEKKNGSIFIAFMGDSKVNQVFESFILETKALDYNIWYEGENHKLREWTFKSFQMRIRKQVVVTIPEVPGFKITYRFASFSEMSDSEILASPHYKELTEWAAAKLAPPDLLVVGYAEWTLRNAGVSSSYATPLETLSSLWATHAAVYRTFLNMHHTKVIVLAQNPMRPHAAANKHYIYNNYVMGDEWTRWSDMGFLNTMKRFRNMAEHQGAQKLPGWKKFFNNHNHASVMRSNYYNRDVSTTHSADTKAYVKRVETRLLHFIEDEEVWFWDSTLPLTYASLRDCDNLHHQDPEASEVIPFIIKINPNSHSIYTYSTLLGLHVDPEDIFRYLDFLATSPNLTNGDGKIFIRPNLGEFHDSIFRPMRPFSLSASMTIGKAFDIAHTSLVDNINDYFNLYAEAYSMPTLHCQDVFHAEAPTKQVEALQILNLICNQFINVDESYCCSN